MFVGSSIVYKLHALYLDFDISWHNKQVGHVYSRAKSVLGRLWEVENGERRSAADTAMGSYD